MFSINEITGQIRTRQRLDREDISIHYFQVEVKDDGNPVKKDQAILTIYVEDINDFVPKFELPSYTLSISENTQLGATVLTVRASDKDSGSNAEIRYSILNPNVLHDDFSINPHSGSITTKSFLDREKMDKYILKVQAADQGPLSNQHSSTVPVTIMILDENDNHPQFSQKSYTIDIMEDIDTTHQPLIASVSAFDPDKGINARVRYTIVGGNSDGNFQIDKVTGQISLLHPLDYENRNGRVYRLHIRAQDGGQPPRTNSTTIIVNVVDVNDNSPRFFPSQYTESVLESENPGFSILRIQAFDSDSGINSELVYSIQNAPDDMPIAINGKTGWITINGHLDREITSKYSFNVEAKDHGTPSRSATADVEIDVIDVNDNSPLFNPRYYEVATSEETPIGSPITVVTASDADSIENARIVYAITGGNIHNTFSIMSQMGKGMISLSQKLNYKDQNQYILTVTATDPGGQTDTCTVKVNVTDANTYRPRFRGTPYVARVKENVPVGASIFKVLAEDDDAGENARISYTISDDTDIFQIDMNTGVISTKKLLDRETSPGYTIAVMAQDHGIPRKSDATDVFIQVEDVNDNAPVFEKQSYNGLINEKVPIGTSVLKISASDQDSGQNGNIHYTFEGGSNGNGDFTLDGTFGVIRTANLLDRETTSLYQLIAFAVDDGLQPKSTSVSIQIRVEDANDNAPQFESHTIQFKVLENSPIGTVVGVVHAVDPDEGENAVIRYFIVGQDSPPAFSLDKSGDDAVKIITNVHLDYEGGPTQYIFTLQAYSGTLLNKVLIHVEVQDVNDNKPVLQNFRIIFNNYLDHFPVNIIGHVPAFDPDVSDRLIYKFISGNEANVLHLNLTTGALKLNYRLNSDVPKHGKLIIMVSDGKNEVSAVCEISTRMVTPKMLYNSISIQIKRMTVSLFLSNLYDKLLDGLSYILHVPVSYITILDVHQDINDNSYQILNVSFCVKLGDEYGDDLYWSPQDLREQVYLRRLMLSEISTLQVMPFHDNLWCVMEPCYYFKECINIHKFGNASSFLSSNVMLFRPIHPVKSYDCQCPKGFTGMKRKRLCDTEVNACYSNPCAANGKCLQREGGFTCICQPGYTGMFCEIDMSTKKYERNACPINICRKPSKCIPLVKGGFHCDNCPKKAFRDEFCQLTTRGFMESSFLMYTSLKRRHRFHIHLVFSTLKKDGLLFYNGRLYPEYFDFIALSVRNGQVEFLFSLGDQNVTRAVTSTSGSVNNGEWQEVNLEYLNRTVWLTVGSDCDRGIYSNFVGNSSHRCAITARKILDERCVDPGQMCFRYLDINGPLHIGGVPVFSQDPRLHSHSFVGCIKDFYIDGMLLDFNEYVAQNMTTEGCLKRSNFCSSNPCKNLGECLNVFGTFKCKCSKGFGGHDCSIVVATRTLLGDSYLEFQQTEVLPIQFPWYNGISFRTNKQDVLLMFIVLGNKNTNATIEVVKGFIKCSLNNHVLVFDQITLSDGKWHHLEIRWEISEVILTLNYGQAIQKYTAMTIGIDGLTVRKIYVGGLLSSATDGGNHVLKGFKGCVKNIYVGNFVNSHLRLSSQYNTLEDCNFADGCRYNPCPKNSTCLRNLDEHRCKCDKGFYGEMCENICENFNPCQHGGICRFDKQSPHGYRCSCNEYHSGKYCEHVIGQPCPKGWYGYPICGPCNCPSSGGFAPSCNTSTGDCVCELNHYKLPGSNECRPCDCYTLGSVSRKCDPRNGQCHCKDGVTGRQCDRCYSRYGEITLQGCQIIYTMCPRNWIDGILWPRTNFSSVATKSCPRTSIGRVTRRCSAKNGWYMPDMFNCLSLNLVNLKNELMKVESHKMKFTTYLAGLRAHQLRKALEDTSILYGSDIDVSYRLLKQLLLYENSLSGLELTHTQNKNYIENLLHAMNYIFDLKYKNEWIVIQNSSAGAEELMMLMERYSHKLAMNMAPTHFPAFDIVVSRIVLGVDMITDSTNEIRIPKYDNKPQNPKMFDNFTKIVISASQLFTKNGNSLLNNFGSNNVAVGYVLYKTLGEILPKSYKSSVRQSRQMAVNAPVFTITLVDKNQTIVGHRMKNFSLDFKLLLMKNRSTPQCVFWNYNSKKTEGSWSGSGCHILKQKTDGYVTCQCNHFSTFSILMDISDMGHQLLNPVTVEIITYIALSVSCFFLFISCMILCCLRRLHSNANNIHVNLMLCIFIAELIFLLGINRVQPVLLCKITAIMLHYFFMCAFAWMFVESLHLYRMLSEIRDVNSGSMKFYYAVGYVIPGIVVGFAVGLHTDGYGNSRFCWLSTNDNIIWSFIGPVCIVYVINIGVFFMAVKASCNVKSPEDLHLLRIGLIAAMFLLPLLGIAWVFGIMSVNEEVLAFHYLFAVFCFLQGLFLMLGHVSLNPRVRYELLRCMNRCRGIEKDDDESLGNTYTTNVSVTKPRSALAYQNTSVDGMVSRAACSVGISTTSTTSRSTDRTSSGGFYGPSKIYRQESTSTSDHPEFISDFTVPNHGYDSSLFHDKSLPIGDPDTGEISRGKQQPQSDSDSDVSVCNASLELASSHSSDNDDEDGLPRWDQMTNFNKHKKQMKPFTKITPKHSTPMCDNSVLNLSHNTHINAENKLPPKARKKKRFISSNSDGVCPTNVSKKINNSVQDSSLPDEESISTQSQIHHMHHPPRVAVQVLTHNGSISSDDGSNETCV
ncbi:cadherin EGF LAG seven-pass G-type receptor 2-like [Tubulanus polymorphus]|uniref:cadherin EGF LAG seven-pass G-type receptor 2-like n=1 Tax=Tubulanus polymorphus TaxID=672921 RepID=UPI003DA2B5CC